MLLSLWESTRFSQVESELEPIGRQAAAADFINGGAIRAGC